MFTADEQVTALAKALFRIRGLIELSPNFANPESPSIPHLCSVLGIIDGICNGTLDTLNITELKDP
jgi:hypothetical protein